MTSERHPQATIPQEVKDQAQKLYLDNVAISDIVVKLKEDNTVVTDQTVRRWIKIYNWDSQKAVSILKAQEKLAQNMAKSKVIKAEEHLKEYRDIRRKAADELQKLKFEDASNAARIVDIAIRGERDIQSGVVSAWLISQLIQILLEEVSDEDVRNRIGLRLRDVVLELEANA